ncbi:MAG: helix-turn-helix transcriptional regulator [Chloroflexota bacterium]|nr:helix-turn-helix transcriptional regulator [Chloroflexota bacterium]MDE2920025.1 helix-turn-helix transcriptional regulator [Chloroflexota bacterium]
MSETRQGMRFAAVLRATRRAAGLSYRRLAQASGISHSFLSHVEKGERRAPPAKAIIALADALDADRTTFALAAIADRAGSDVATTMVMALQRGPVGRDVDPTAGGVLIESGPDGAESHLADLADQADAVAEIERRLAFVDLQLDAGFMRLAISSGSGADPIVLFVSARADSDVSDD